ncbi:MAG: hypothetical protein AAF799_17565 [Myxococcota bacterium]
MVSPIRCVALLLPLAVGCSSDAATSTEVPAHRADRDAPDPSRIYTVGEAHFARGEYSQAVELWRQAIVKLPPTSDADDLRHALILRRAYGQLMAWHHQGDEAHLHDAKQMLERYLVRHEELLGTTDDALAQRGEVYELLFEVERALEPPPVVQTSELRVDDPNEEDKEFEADGDADIQRTVVVRATQTDVDDPKMRGKLRSSFTDPFFDGLVLTAPTAVLLHGPRPLLRAGGVVQLAETEGSSVADRRRARSLGRHVLATARDRLKDCYQAAYTRHPVAAARSTVQVTVGEDGKIRDAEIVTGGLVDTLGDLCVLDELESTAIEDAELLETDGAIAIRVPLTFFYQGPVYLNEGTGSSAPAGVLHQVDATPGANAPRAPGSAPLAPGAPGSSIPGRAMGA